MNPETKKTMRLLKRRALTLISKLQEFQELAATIYPEVSATPNLEGTKQALMDFYTQ
jgi:hypothetical protein